VTKSSRGLLSINTRSLQVLSVMNYPSGGVFDPVFCLRQSRIDCTATSSKSCFCENCGKELLL